MSISTSVRFSVLERDGFQCVYCGAAGSSAKLHVDHIVAVSLGGADEYRNLAAACEGCNLGKAARAIHGDRYAGIIAGVVGRTEAEEARQAAAAAEVARQAKAAAALARERAEAKEAQPITNPAAAIHNLLATSKRDNRRVAGLVGERENKWHGWRNGKQVASSAKPGIWQERLALHEIIVVLTVKAGVWSALLAP